jgi:DNA-binding transcriptional LysR family regulator
MVNESNAHLAAALADFMVRPAVERGDLVVTHDAWRSKPLDVYISYAPSRQLSTKVRVFADWVTQIYGHIQSPPTPTAEGLR